MTELIYKSLPNWVLDVVIAVQEHEDVHRSVRDGGICLESVLDSVPTEVRIAAKAVAEYRRQEATP